MLACANGQHAHGDPHMSARLCVGDTQAEDDAACDEGAGEPSRHLMLFIAEWS